MRKVEVRADVHIAAARVEQDVVRFRKISAWRKRNSRIEDNVAGLSPKENTLDSGKINHAPRAVRYPAIPNKRDAVRRTTKCDSARQIERAEDEYAALANLLYIDVVEV